MRQADFAGAWRSRTAADEPGVRYRVVRRTERPADQQSDAARKEPGDAMDLRGLDGFLKSQRRQDSGESFGEHRFAGPRRSDEKHIVPSGSGHFERPLGAG